MEWSGAKDGKPGGTEWGGRWKVWWSGTEGKEEAGRKMEVGQKAENKAEDEWCDGKEIK